MTGPASESTGGSAANKKKQLWCLVKLKRYARAAGTVWQGELELTVSATCSALCQRSLIAAVLGGNAALVAMEVS